MILGIDEVGRGPWAGPLVVGAVVLGGVSIDGLTDSKKLSKKKREELDIVIRGHAAGYGLGWVSAHEIDEIGLSAALVLATKRAVEQVKAPYHEIVIDGTVNFLTGTTKGRYVTTMKKADLLVPSVSAASVIAKVARDNYMAEQDDLYPCYKFASHVGYGTAVHRAAIKEHGVTPLHRLSFAPLATYRTHTPPVTLSSERHSDLDSGSNKNESKSIGFRIKSEMTRVGNSFSVINKKRNENDTYLVNSNKNIIETTKKIGDRAEDEVANYLVRYGHEIIERNWKTKYCEIDIVSLKHDTLYFTEVKYRKNSAQGGGFAAITSKKLNQMTFAARYYAQAKHVTSIDLLLCVASVTGSRPQVEDFIELAHGT